MADYLPGVLSEIAAIVGEGSALKIAREKGGGRCHFPADPKAGHWLVSLIGVDKARRLCRDLSQGTASDGDRLRGLYIDVPLGPTGTRADLHRTIERLYREGQSHDSIARTLGVSRRTVLRRLSDGLHRDPDGRQPDLFG